MSQESSDRRLLDRGARHPRMVPPMLTDRRISGRSDLLAVGVATTAVVAAVWQALASEWIDRAGGCGFDGSQYCLMATGDEAQLPFARRVLLPALVRALTLGDVLHRFLVVNVLAVMACVVLAYAVTRRMAVWDSRAPAVIVASLTLLNPWTWHIVMAYPALTDEMALALGLGWLLAVVSRNPWISVPLAAAAVLTRESWAPVLLVGILYAAFTRRLSPMIAAASTVAVGVATVYCFTRPGLAYAMDTGPLDTVRFWVSSNFLHPEGFVRFAAMALSGLGTVCLAGIVVGRPTLATFERRLALLMAVGMAGLAAVGGGDTDRLLLTPFVLVAAIVVPLLLGRMGVGATALLIAGTIVMWRPWSTPAGDDASFISYFAVRAIPRPDLLDWVTFEVVVVLVTGALLGAMYAYRKSLTPVSAREASTESRAV
jgi:hypothetical protein